jgi:hypothetical protein
MKMTIADALPEGTVVLLNNDDFGVMWAWNGGHQVRIVSTDSFKDLDVFNFHNVPGSVSEALEKAQARLEMLEEECRDGDQDDEDGGEDYDYDYEDDGQPDEAQEWYDFDPDC